MTSRAQIEKEILELPPAEREQLALRMWESIIEDDLIRILVIRHHRRHPEFGIERVGRGAPSQ